MIRSIPFIIGVASLAIGTAAAIMISSLLSSNLMVADRILLNYAEIGAKELPKKLEEADKLGWTGTIRCHAYKGRYFHKPYPNTTYPLSLIFNPKNALIGIYVYARV